MKDDNNKKKEVFETCGYSCTYLIPNDRYMGEGARAIIKKKQRKHQDNEQYIRAFYDGSSSATSKNKKTKNDLRIGTKYGDEGEDVLVVRNDFDKYEKKGYVKHIYPNSTCIKTPFHYVIPEKVNHLTYELETHGEEKTRQIGSNNLSLNRIMRRVKQKDFNHLKTFYWRSNVCHGGWLDKQGASIFGELQNKLSKCGTTHPNVFVSLVKSEYALTTFITFDDTATKQIGTRRVPFKQDAIIDIEDVEKNKDEYFDYYYITKDKIYKIPHSIVENRVALTEKGEFEEALKKANPVEVKIEDIDGYKESKEQTENSNNLNKISNKNPKYKTGKKNRGDVFCSNCSIF